MLEDMTNNYDLLFSWLYSEYATSHDLSQVNRFIATAGKKEKEKQYDDVLSSIVMKTLAKEATKERDE